MPASRGDQEPAQQKQKGTETLEWREEKAEQHVFQLKMKPHLDSGLRSPGKVTLSLAQD